MDTQVRHWRQSADIYHDIYGLLYSLQLTECDDFTRQPAATVAQPRTLLRLLFSFVSEQHIGAARRDLSSVRCPVSKTPVSVQSRLSCKQSARNDSAASLQYTSPITTPRQPAMRSALRLVAASLVSPGHGPDQHRCRSHRVGACHRGRSGGVGVQEGAGAHAEVDQHLARAHAEGTRRPAYGGRRASLLLRISEADGTRPRWKQWSRRRWRTSTARRPKQA